MGLFAKTNKEIKSYRHFRCCDCDVSLHCFHVQIEKDTTTTLAFVNNLDTAASYKKNDRNSETKTHCCKKESAKFYAT